MERVHLGLLARCIAHWPESKGERESFSIQSHALRAFPRAPRHPTAGSSWAKGSLQAKCANNCSIIQLGACWSEKSPAAK